MKKVIVLLLALLSGGGINHGAFVTAPVDQVVIFAGQSDGIVSAVSCSQLIGTYSYLQPAISNVKISDMSGNFSTYHACVNSNPLGTQSGGQTTNWGVEAQWVYRWSQDNPTKTLYIIKVEAGSTPLFNNGNATDCGYPPLGFTNANWSPESNSTNCFNITTNLVTTALAGLVTAGKNPQVVGINWMQGYQDAGNPSYAPFYQTNLTDFIIKARISWAGGSPVPIVIERMINKPAVPCVQPYVATVQAAQDANASASTPVINTDSDVTFPVVAGSCEYTNTGAVNLGDAMYNAYLTAVPVTAGWHQVNLGGGGLEVGSDFPTTGVRFVKSDNGGAYMWNTTTSRWSQIMCQTCIPANATPGAYNFGYYPTTGASQVFQTAKPGVNGSGVLGLAGAPSDATVAYVFANGHVLVSTTVDPAHPENIALVDTGPVYSSAVTNATWAANVATFTVTRPQNQCAVGCFFTVSGVTPSGYNGTYTATSVSGSTVTAALVSNPGGNLSVAGTFHSIPSDYYISPSRFLRALNVDPNNKDHVIVATQYDGIFETFNGTAGGSATWTPLSASVPVLYAGGSGGVFQIPLVAFDANSGVTGGLTNTVYVWTNGTTAGVYKTTTTTTGSWSLMAGSPATAQNIQVTTATIGQGDVWVTDGATASTAGVLWQFTGGTWNNRTAACCNGGISINPNNGNQIVSVTPKLLYVSTNGGTSFTNYKAGTVATDSPWQAWMASRSSLTVGSVSFDPAVNGQIWFTGGQGVWYTPTLPSAAFNWTSNVLGIETLTGLSGLAVHSAYHPVYGASDEAGCQINVLSQPLPPTTCIPTAGVRVQAYFSNLYVPPANPTFMVGKGNYNTAAPEFSGYSTDGFDQSWLPFNTWNTTVSSAALSTNAGAIKVDVSGGTTATTSALTTWAPGNTGSQNSILCGYGSSVARNPTTPDVFYNTNWICYTVTVNDATHFTLNHSTFAALQNPLPPNYTFFAPSTTLFSDWRGSFHITTVVDDGTGKVKVTVVNGQSNNIPAGSVVCITGVVMTGATVVNGCWIVTSSSAGVYVLQDSTFAGGDSLVTAGTLTSWNLPGGSIAASTSSNIAIAATDQGRLQCSTDGGQTWTANQPVPYQQTTVTGGPFTAGSTTINLASTSGYSNGTIFTLQLDDGSSIYLTQSGAPSGSTITFAPALPAGVSVSTGNAVWSNTVGSGYGFAAYGNIQILAADFVAANTFYAVNSNAGLYSWTNCGTPTLIKNTTGGWLTNAGINSQLKTVPGESGHLFYTAGAAGSTGDPHPVSSGLWRSCTGTQGTTTVERVYGFYEVHAFGFGKAKPGKSYASEYVFGWYASDNVQAHAVLGTWKSVDDPNHGATGACNVASNAQTWTNLGAYPTGWQYTFSALTGDPYVYGMVYGDTTAGWYYGYFP